MRHGLVDVRRAEERMTDGTIHVYVALDYGPDSIGMYLAEGHSDCYVRPGVLFARRVEKARRRVDRAALKYRLRAGMAP